MSSLGKRWGSCYDTCTQLPPRPPRCSPSDAATTTKCSSTTMSSGDPCPTVCADGVDGCGVPFSTCFPRCSTSLWPNKSCSTTIPTRTTSPPFCTASDVSSTVASSSLKTSSLITSSDFNACSTQTVCQDFLKTCEEPAATSTLVYGG